MEIRDVSFCTTDWSAIAPTAHAGERGIAYWRTLEMGNIRVRIVEYTPGYKADHWCERGHVLYVLEGELTTELANGECYTLKSGCSYQVADKAAPHRSRTETGAKLFVVD
jgi:quercetin dioxygenase-like cupin family protein